MKLKSVFIKLLILVTFAVAAFALSSCLMPPLGCYNCKTNCGNKHDKDENEGLGVTYVLNDGGGYSVESVGYKESDVIIPATYLGQPVTGIKEGAFVHYIPPAGCSGGYDEAVRLNNLTLPASINTIERGAFFDRSCIYNVHFEGSVQDWCNIKFGSTPIFSGTQLYIGGELVKNLVVPGSVETVNAMAFMNYTYLESVTFEDGVKVIESYAFYDCTELLSAVLPSTLEEIHDNAFSYCGNLVEIFNLSSLKLIEGSSAYGGIAKNALVIFSDFDEESALKRVDEYLFVTAEDENYLIKYYGNGGDVILPNGIDGQNYVIRHNTFKDNYNVTSVSLNDTVTAIGDSAFESCNNLKSINLSNVKKLGKYAFAYCGNLKEVTLSGLNADGLAEDVFYGCRSLGKVVLPENISVIPKYAFSSCYSLKEINFPDKAQCTIEGKAFANCEALKKVVIPAGYSVNGEAFNYCTSLESVEFNCAEVEFRAFSGCLNLSKVILKEGVEEIDLGAFDRTAVKEINFPASCKKIYAWLSVQLSSFTVADGNGVYFCQDNCLIKRGDAGNTVILGNENSRVSDDITYIGDYAFAYSKLQKLSLPSSVKALGSYAFYGSELKEADLTNVTQIGSCAFAYCGNLKTVTLSENLKTINNRTFSYCESLTAITLPENLRNLGTGAFENSGLKSIVIPDGVKEIPYFCFAYCANLSEITLPQGLEKSNTNSFLNTNGTTPVTVRYKGTKEEWRRVNIYFPYGAKVYCTDGIY